MTLPGIDRATTCVEQRRVFHALNDVDHDIQPRIACLQLAITRFNRRVQKVSIFKRLLIRHT